MSRVVARGRVIFLVSVLCAAGSACPAGPPEFLRGDVDGDGVIAFYADYWRLLTYLFFDDQPALPCADAADCNDDGVITTLDALVFQSWFSGYGTPPADPGPTRCGPDPDDEPPGCATPPDPCPGTLPDRAPSLELRVSHVLGEPGTEVTVSVTLTNDTEFVRGWQFSLCHGDLVALDSSGLAPGVDLVDLEVSLSSLFARDDAWVGAVILDASTDSVLAAGAMSEIYTAIYELGDAEGFAPLSFCETGDPILVNAVLVEDHEAVVPEFADGSIGIGPGFHRGDADGDGVVVALLDAMFLLVYGFLDGPAPPCADAADADDDGAVDPLVDAVFTLEYAFAGGLTPPYPGPTGCGVDATTGDAFDCDTPGCD